MSDRSERMWSSLCPCFPRTEDNSEDSLFPGTRSRDINASPSERPKASASLHGRAPSPQAIERRLSALTVEDIVKYTNNFSPELEISQDSLGTVYKVQLPGKNIVAVKRAKKEQFAGSQHQLRNEVSLLKKIEHNNLVRFLGYVENKKERLIITEYVPNGTLRDHLDGKYGTVLDFFQRLEIAIDVAHGLTYLHINSEKPIIHRDVKSTNVLLTENLRAKLTDFGFARVGSTDPDQSQVMTKIRGTAGYADPEYWGTNRLTPKSDVYSYGILLLEIISGRRPVDVHRIQEERVTVRWAFEKFHDGKIREILDPRLYEVPPEEIVRRTIDLAFQCAAPTRHDRPEMEKVQKELWEIRKDLWKNQRILS